MGFLRISLGLLASLIAIFLTLIVQYSGMLLGSPAQGWLVNESNRNLVRFVALVAIGLLVGLQEARGHWRARRAMVELREYKEVALQQILEQALEDIAPQGVGTRIWVYRVSRYFLFFRRLVTVAATVQREDWVDCKVRECIAGMALVTEGVYEYTPEVKIKPNFTERQSQVMEAVRYGVGHRIFASRSRNRLVGVLVIDSDQLSDTSGLKEAESEAAVSKLADRVRKVLD